MQNKLLPVKFFLSCFEKFNIRDQSPPKMNFFPFYLKALSPS